MRRTRSLKSAGGLAAAALLISIGLPAQAETIRIKIEILAFSPSHVAAHVGDTVEWTNGDFIDHTATARNGAFDVTLPANASKRIVLKSAGRIEYYCKFHPHMTGEITVSK